MQSASTASKRRKSPSKGFCYPDDAAFPTMDDGKEARQAVELPVGAGLLKVQDDGLDRVSVLWTWGVERFADELR